jgi:tetratricopeptide (TPR) repeat protein
MPQLATLPSRLAFVLFQQGKTELAIEQYRHALKIDPQLAAARLGLGVALARTGRLEEAITELAEAVRINPDDAQARFNLAVALAEQGSSFEALEHLEASARLAPGFAEAHLRLARLLVKLGRTQAAHARYAEALRLRPSWPVVEQEVAWLLATHPDASFRDGPRAVELAERACRATDFAEPTSLDTLAAAHARANQFPEAIQMAQSALANAQRRGNQDLAARIEQRLALYQAGKTFEEPPSSSPARP